ncbi:MAG: hypothetical protein ACRD2G_02175 [Terriglobia bacterium]
MANNYIQVTVSPELPASLFSDEELQSLDAACGLHCHRHDDVLYFFADDYFCEEDDDHNDQHINCIDSFQAKLKQLDPASYPYILIEGAATCNKMRAHEFGGIAYFITRDEVRHMSTWQWLDEMESSRNKGVRVEP